MENSKDQLATRPWRLLPLLMAITAIGPGALNIVAPALPGMIEHLGSDAATVQLTLSLYLLGLACAQLVLGPLSDRFGRRPVLLAGLVLSVLASIAAIAASSIGALIVARIVQAAGASTGVVVGRAIVRDLYDRDRAAGIIGLVTSAMVIAPMVAPLIGGLLDTAFGWQAIFIFITVVSAAVLLWAALILPETCRPSTAPVKAAYWSEWTALLGNSKFHAYIVAGALGSAPYFTFLGGGPHIVITLMGRSSAEYGLWFALSSFGYMAGNFTVSRLVQRYGLDTLIIAGIGFEIAGACLTALMFVLLPDGGPATVFLPQLIINYGNGLLLPNCIAGAISIKAQTAGTASGLSGFSQMAFGAGATQVISILLAGGTSPLPMAWMMLAITVVAAVLFKVLIKR
jgi:DHA1 family bicyclomycin/chloramphenicol resistance-like MFS transporter